MTRSEMIKKIEQHLLSRFLRCSEVTRGSCLEGAEEIVDLINDESDEHVELYFWDPSQNKEVTVVTTLENIIRNPSGFRMDHVGVRLLNKERKSRGLTEYRFNHETGTFDEVMKVVEYEDTGIKLQKDLVTK